MEHYQCSRVSEGSSLFQLRLARSRLLGQVTISLTCFTFSLFNLAGLQVEAEQRVMMVAEGNSTYLECLPRSRHAAVTWYKQAGENSAELNQVQSHVLHLCFHLCSKSFLQPLCSKFIQIINFLSKNLSSGDNWWPAGGDRAGRPDSSSRAVSRRGLPLPGGGARLPLDCGHRAPRCLEPLCQSPPGFLVGLVLSERRNPAVVRERDGTDSPRKPWPALQGSGIPPSTQPPSPWWHKGGATQGEREAQAWRGKRRRRRRRRKSSGEEEQEQAAAEGAEECLNASTSGGADFQWLQQLHKHANTHTHKCTHVHIHS